MAPPFFELLKVYCKYIKPLIIQSQLCFCKFLANICKIKANYDKLKSHDRKKTIRVSKSVYWTNDHVPHIKEPKTNAGIREVPIMDALYDILLPLKKRPSDYVFGLLHSYQIDKGFARYQEKTGLGVTLHGLRHGFASILYKNNVDIKTAAYVLGHAQTSTTLEIYTHLMEQDKLRTVRNALNAI